MCGLLTSISVPATLAPFDESDDMLLSPDEVVMVLAKTEIKLSRQEIQKMVHYLDKDGNGELDIEELEDAIRNARKQKRGTVTDAVTRLARAEVPEVRFCCRTPP